VREPSRCYYCEINMILGIGTDLVNIGRIDRIIDTYSDRFINKIFTRREQEYCSRFKFSAAKFANRFAAKESICKSLGLGIGKYTWKDIEVVNDENGKPLIELHNAALEFFHSINAKRILVSISDTQEYSMAFCVIEG